MHYVEVKGILSAKNGMNIYRGCQHGCIYCDSRSKCYNMNHDFEDIEVKINAPMLLEMSLRSKKKHCMIGTGSMTDPYIPLEKDLKLTRRCLEIIDRYGFGVSILTKSNLILRDLDLLKSIHNKSKCVVQMTLTTAHDHLCRILEPGVCVTSKRVEVLKEMQRQGIPTIVWLCPFLPYINDTEENIKALLDMCVDAGVKGIICFGIGVTLREGSREYFYQKLDQFFPGLKDIYIRQFGNSYMVNSKNHYKIMRMVEKTCIEHNMIHTPEACFEYLNEYPTKFEQMSLF